MQAEIAARTDKASRTAEGVRLELEIAVPATGDFTEAQVICKMTNETKEPLFFGFGGEGAHGMCLVLKDRKGKAIPYTEKGQAVFDPKDFTKIKSGRKYALNALRGGETLQYHTRLGDCFELKDKQVDELVLTWNRRWDLKAKKYPPIRGLEVVLKLPPSPQAEKK